MHVYCVHHGGPKKPRISDSKGVGVTAVSLVRMSPLRQRRISVFHWALLRIDLLQVQRLLHKQVGPHGSHGHDCETSYHGNLSSEFWTSNFVAEICLTSDD